MPSIPLKPILYLTFFSLLLFSLWKFGDYRYDQGYNTAFTKQAIVIEEKRIEAKEKLKKELDELTFIHQQTIQSDYILVNKFKNLENELEASTKEYERRIDEIEINPDCSVVPAGIISVLNDSIDRGSRSNP